MATKVGFIGLGRIGKPMAINVLKAGFDLMVYDLREEPLKEFASLGAKMAHSAREVGEYGDIIELAVVGDAQVEDVLLGEAGVLKVTRPGAIIAIHSTIHPKTGRKIAELAKASGVGVVDAEISGGETGARTQTLCYMVGGDKALFEKCRPVFATSGTNIFHMGEVGMGAMTKLAHQILVGVNMLGTSEALLFAEKAGLDLSAFQQVVHVSAGQSVVADNWFERFKVNDVPIAVRRRRMEVFHTGLSAVLETAHDLGVSLPGVALVQQLLSRVLGIEEL